MSNIILDADQAVLFPHSPLKHNIPRIFLEQFYFTEF